MGVLCVVFTVRYQAVKDFVGMNKTSGSKDVCIFVDSFGQNSGEISSEIVDSIKSRLERENNENSMFRYNFQELKNCTRIL